MRDNDLRCPECRVKSGGYVSGQAFTEFTCAKCGEKYVWHNTKVPKYCWNCSIEHKICIDCGKDIPNLNLTDL